MAVHVRMLYEFMCVCVCTTCIVVSCGQLIKEAVASRSSVGLSCAEYVDKAERGKCQSH